jgi:glutathione S-transferase
MMQLYDGGRVPNARRVRIFLAEKGITVPMTPVDLGKKDHKSEAFTKLNPLQRVPVLVLDDGTVLTESIAICRYFEELHPTPPLFGTGAKGKALVEMWQRRLEWELYIQIGHAFRHLHPAMAGYEVPQVAEWGHANQERALRYMTQLDADLAGREFIAGDAFSVADITGLIALDFAKAAKIEISPELDNIRRWHATLSARPSAKA